MSSADGPHQQWTAVSAHVMTCGLQAAALKFLSSPLRTISYAIGCRISHHTFKIGINSIKKLFEAKQPGFRALIKIFLWLEAQIQYLKIECNISESSLIFPNYFSAPDTLWNSKLQFYPVNSTFTSPPRSNIYCVEKHMPFVNSC